MIPYVPIDGIRTLKDSEIKALFAQTQKDGLVPILFYNGGIQTADDFLRYMQSTALLWIFKNEQRETLGYAWLDRFEDRTARIHGGIFKEHRKYASAIGRLAYERILYMKDNGRYLYDVIIGIIPTTNKAAITFAKACGGQECGVIPKMMWDHYQQQSKDAMLLYFRRD